MTHLYLEHKMEFNQRVQFDTQNWVNSFGLQLTYEGSMVLRLNKLIDRNSKGLFFPLKFNLYWNIVEAELFNDVIKIRPGIGYHFNTSWTALFLLGYNYIKDLEASGFRANNLIFKFQFIHLLHE